MICNKQLLELGRSGAPGPKSCSPLVMISCHSCCWRVRTSQRPGKTEPHYWPLQWSGLPQWHVHGEQSLGAGEINAGSSQTAPAQRVLRGSNSRLCFSGDAEANFSASPRRHFCMYLVLRTSVPGEILSSIFFICDVLEAEG